MGYFSTNHVYLTRVPSNPDGGDRYILVEVMDDENGEMTTKRFTWEQTEEAFAWAVSKFNQKSM